MRVELARWSDRLVVVKRLVGHNPILAERLQREAEVVKKLAHPNIVPLLASEEGALIYTYIPGVSLAEVLEGGPLKLKRCAKILRSTLSALHYAHEQGVIHCDLKPANILIKGEETLVTDFGFAKDLRMAAITSDQTMLGTPTYMSPEQFRGVRTDPRSDVYAAGAVLYHTLTGFPPHGSPSQAIRFLAGDDRVPIEPLRGEAEVLQEVVDRALMRDPNQRYEGAQEMCQSLNLVCPN
jgi:serine/threonine protein kinase